MTVGNAVGAGEGRDVTKTSFLPRVKKEWRLEEWVRDE